MAIFQQNSRLVHHTVLTSGITFSVPEQQDFTITGTTSAWYVTDLDISEFGVNEPDKELFIRIGNEIKQVDVWSNPITATVSGEITAVNILDIPIDNSKFYQIETRVIIKPNIDSDTTGYFTDNVFTDYYVGLTFSSTRINTNSTNSFTTTGIDYSFTGTGSFATFSVRVNTLPISTTGVAYKLQYRIWTF